MIDLDTMELCHNLFQTECIYCEMRYDCNLSMYKQCLVNQI